MHPLFDTFDIYLFPSLVFLLVFFSCLITFQVTLKLIFGIQTNLWHMNHIPLLKLSNSTPTVDRIKSNLLNPAKTFQLYFSIYYPSLASRPSRCFLWTTLLSPHFHDFKIVLILEFSLYLHMDNPMCL